MELAKLGPQVLALVTPSLLLLFLATQVVQVLALYVAARLVVPGGATLGQAATAYAANLLMIIGWAILLAAGLVGLGLLGAAGGLLARGFFLAWVAALIWGAFQVPMRVFEVGAGRALLLMVVTLVITSALNVPLNLMLRPSVDPQALANLMAAVPRPPGAPALPALAPAPKGQGALDRLSSAIANKTSPDRPVPHTVHLAEDTQVPILIGGKVAGDVMLERGTELEVVRVEGNTVHVRHLDAVVKLPKDKLVY